MAKKVILSTTITAINGPCYIRPTSQMWVLVNDGFDFIIINNTFRVADLMSFGINADDLQAAFLQRGIVVENTTQYQIAFEPEYPGAASSQSAKLIQTFVKIVDE